MNNALLDQEVYDASEPEDQAQPAAKKRFSFSGNGGAWDLGNDADGCLVALGLGIAVLLVALAVKSFRNMRSATTPEKRLVWGLVFVSEVLALCFCALVAAAVVTSAKK